jgi:hypothetical protein
MELKMLVFPVTPDLATGKDIDAGKNVVSELSGGETFELLI